MRDRCEGSFGNRAMQRPTAACETTTSSGSGDESLEATKKSRQVSHLVTTHRGGIHTRRALADRRE